MQFEYSEDTTYIALIGIKLLNLPNKIEISGHQLIRKSEFHVSIMALKHIETFFADADTGKIRSNIVDHFNAFVEFHDMSQISLTNKFHFVKKDERESIIVIVKMPFLEELFKSICAKFSIDLPAPPAHITLYTLDADKGIGVHSAEQLQSFGQRVELRELNSLELIRS